MAQPVTSKRSSKARKHENSQEVKERCRKFVRDFYERHGAAMTVLAFE